MKKLIIFLICAFYAYNHAAYIDNVVVKSYLPHCTKIQVSIAAKPKSGQCVIPAFPFPRQATYEMLASLKAYSHLEYIVIFSDKKSGVVRIQQDLNIPVASVDFENKKTKETVELILRTKPSDSHLTEIFKFLTRRSDNVTILHNNYETRAVLEQRLDLDSSPLEHAF